MSELKFWYSPGACSFAPHVLLNEAGLIFDGQETFVSKDTPLTEE